MKVVVILGVFSSLEENWSSDSGMSFMSRSRICEKLGRREGPASEVDARLPLRSYCTGEYLDIRSRGVRAEMSSIKENAHAPGWSQAEGNLCCGRGQ